MLLRTVVAYYDGYSNPQPADQTFVVTVEDTCETTTLHIKPVILPQLSIEYMIEKPAIVITLDPSLVLSTPQPLLSCSAIEFSLANSDGSPTLAPLFTYSPLTYQFTIFSNDMS